MRLLISIGHPAQVHLFKNFIIEMKRRGHEILVVAYDKDLTLELLNHYCFNYINLGTYKKSFIGKVVSVPLIDMKLYKISKSFNPHIFLGGSPINLVHISKIMKRPSIVFDDDEYTYPYYSRFVTTICAFSGFKITGEKIIKLNGFKELAYLHPNWFKPRFINELNKIKKEIVLLRFVGWNAFHDKGKAGFDLDSKRRLVNELEKYCTVFISSEASLPEEFEKNKFCISPAEMHNILYYAKLLVCDSQTMTTEAGVLGTPAVRCNSFVNENDMGNFIELENKYDLIYNFREPEAAINKAIELVQRKNIKEEWKIKRDKLLTEKIDVTSFMIWFVENYPESITVIKNDQEFVNKFK